VRAEPYIGRSKVERGSSSVSARVSAYRWFPASGTSVRMSPKYVSQRLTRSLMRGVRRENEDAERRRCAAPLSFGFAGGAMSAPLADPRLREPEIIEREAGYHLARYADQSVGAKPQVRERCGGCAFRFGTEANTYGPTILDAMKCVLERVPFYCHEGPLDKAAPICAGWALCVERGGGVVEAPWPFAEDIARAAAGGPCEQGA
jgi:hypothetical protein